jgi:hypothetical protein
VIFAFDQMNKWINVRSLLIANKKKKKEDFMSRFRTFILNVENKFSTNMTMAARKNEPKKFKQFMKMCQLATTQGEEAVPIGTMPGENSGKMKESSSGSSSSGFKSWWAGISQRVRSMPTPALMAQHAASIC